MPKETKPDPVAQAQAAAVEGMKGKIAAREVQHERIAEAMEEQTKP